MKVASMSMAFSFLLLVLILPACAAQTGPPAPEPPATPPALPPLTSATSSPERAGWEAVVAAGKKEGKVTIYSYSWTGDIGLAIAKAFENRYGIKLEIITGRGAEFTERIKVEKRAGNRVGDLTEGSSTLLTNMKVEKLLTSVYSSLPVFQERDVWGTEPSALDPAERTVLIYTINTYSPYINTNLVKPGQEPRVWRDLLAPQWKSKMVLKSPSLCF